MNVEEEIEIYRFGQGVYSVEAVLERFARVAESEKRMELMDLYALVIKNKPVADDSDQAIGSSGLDPADPACVAVKNHPFTARVMHVPMGDTNHVYRLLLYVFKQAYQRQLALKKDSATNWRYTDLLQGDTVQRLLSTHQSLAEEIYTNPGFRNEFTSLTKLWHNARIPAAPKPSDSASEGQVNAAFMSYDDLVTESVNHHFSKDMHAASLLHGALRKGLAVRYQLNMEEAVRLLTEVLERHMKETFGTDLLGA